PTAAKAALMELQYDEYGAGDPNRVHSHLFARGLEAVGLRSEYGAYVDDVPLEILEQNNAMSLMGLHRRLRGAALGHLAAFEATSSLPSRQLSRGLGRLGLTRETAPEMAEYYDEHVEADAVHEQLAVRAICGELLAVEPGLRDDVYFGAFTCLDLEDRLAHHLLTRWGAAT
ncbi:MAG: iron-containing redox enzyme family protein, partial [Nocardioides sp.]|nr:iron-containing redox enzyme family protein [Nocardioides sp.]